MENTKHRLTIRIGHNSLAFTAGAAFEPYTLKSKMSMAANLREAFQQNTLPAQDFQGARVLVDSPALMVPLREFDEQQAAMLFQQTHGHHGELHEQATVMHNVMDSLNAVVVYQLNSDLRLVIEDHFENVSYEHMMQDVWTQSYQQNRHGKRNRLFAHLHDKRLEAFCFDANRFRFCNSFEINDNRDAAYFLLAVWKQLAFDSQSDEIYLSFDPVQSAMAEMQHERQSLADTLRRYVKNVHLPED